MDRLAIYALLFIGLLIASFKMDTRADVERGFGMMTGAAVLAVWLESKLERRP